MNPDASGQGAVGEAMDQVFAMQNGLEERGVVRTDRPKPVLRNLPPLRPVAGERANRVANAKTVPQNVPAGGRMER